MANVFVTAQSGSATLRYRTPIYRWPLALVPFLLWGAAAAVLWRTRTPSAPPEADTQLIPILTGRGA